MDQTSFMSVDHIAYATRDAVKTAAFYQALGFKLVVQSQPIDMFGVFITKLISPKNEIIELVEPFKNNSVVSRLLKETDVCLYHLAFKVKDLESSQRALCAEGALIVTEPMVIPYPATPAHEGMRASHMFHPVIGLFEITG